MFRQGFQFPFLILVTGNIRESKLVPPFDQLRPGRCKLPYCGNGGITSPYHNSVCHIGHPFHGRQIVGRGIENIDEVLEFLSDKIRIHDENTAVIVRSAIKSVIKNVSDESKTKIVNDIAEQSSEEIAALISKQISKKLFTVELSNIKIKAE